MERSELFKLIDIPRGYPCSDALLNALSTTFTIATSLDEKRVRLIKAEAIREVSKMFNPSYYTTTYRDVVIKLLEKATEVENEQPMAEGSNSTNG